MFRRPYFYCNLNIFFLAFIYIYHERHRFPENCFNPYYHHHPRLHSHRHSIQSDELRSIYIGNNLRNQRLVKVLIWTKYHKAGPLTAVEDWGRKVSESITQCPIRCQFTANRQSLHEADAVVFYSGNINKQDMPHHHPFDQVWVYLDEEPPKRSRWDLQEIPNVFNWTMTYRRDSDIYHPYGQVIPLPKPRLHETTLRSFLLERQLVAWTVSNCITSSKREQWAVELRKHIPVQIYGRCGSEAHKCIDDWPDGCLNEIESKFKFYLAFENSLCSQYVSEKFFNTLTRNLVPIVYGFENYSKIAPNGSFIDARAFKTPKALADYLLYLDKTPEEYLKYFEWKKQFTILPKGSGWCRLCQRLARGNGRERKVYENIWEWWWYQEKTSDDIQSNSSHENETSESKKLACFDGLDIL